VGSGEWASETYVHGIVLVELGVLLDLAQHDQDGGHAGKGLVASAFIILPGADEMVDALLEDLAIDADVCHLGGLRDGDRVGWVMADGFAG
jgi:hypothetical protein